MSTSNKGEEPHNAISAIYRRDSRRVLATLIRLLSDIDLAEEALQEAFAAAVSRWPKYGIPANPRAWLVSAGRFKAIDILRRKGRDAAHLEEFAQELAQKGYEKVDSEDSEKPGIYDDRLRLIFLCCHPVNPPDAQVALTLREVCGLGTEEIADAFLVEVPTLAKRIVRAKARLREARIPYEVPPLAELPNRLDAVFKVIYLVFNEGYSASSGASLLRTELSSEAIRLGRLLIELLPDPEATGLLSLMLLQESRRRARISPSGDLVLLNEQDRTLWDREQIDEGTALAAQALKALPSGIYTLQAAIAAVHAQTVDFESTDWKQIVILYDELLRVSPSPVIELNRAVAVSMTEGPEAALAEVDRIMAGGALAGYQLAYSVHADLNRRLGRTQAARVSYKRALSLTRQGPERIFLQKKLNELLKN